MGLFADAVEYGGRFYREFDQSHGAGDLETNFGEFQVAMGAAEEGGGVCAGCCYHWIKHYLKFPGVLYDNETMRQGKSEIMTVQLWVRAADVSLADLLRRSGMTSNGVNMAVSNSSNATLAADELKNTGGIYTLSYGGHVVVCFNDARDGHVYFMDVHRGDVILPQASCGPWLLTYLELMHKKHGPIVIEGFAAAWSDAVADRLWIEMERDLDRSVIHSVAHDWKILNPPPLEGHFPIM